MAASIDVDESYRIFVARVLRNKALPRIDNSTLPAGSPMHYPCKGCRADMGRDEDDFGPKQEYCSACEGLHAAGVLDDFKKRLEQAA